jgi:ABC-type spermidine/putrescine transport system permease subunit I
MNADLIRQSGLKNQHQAADSDAWPWAAALTFALILILMLSAFIGVHRRHQYAVG